MKLERMLELLAYAKVCFEHSTSFFETIHLEKKNVTADECKELSAHIAEAIESFMVLLPFPTFVSIKDIENQAEREFMETQQE